MLRTSKYLVLSLLACFIALPALAPIKRMKKRRMKRSQLSPYLLSTSRSWRNPAANNSRSSRRTNRHRSRTSSSA